MKILIVGNNKPRRFAPFVEEQARALQKQGCEVVFFSVQGKGLIGYLRCLPALKRAIQQHQPDLIHAHYGLSGLLANLQRRVPVVTTYHGSDINKPNILRFSKIAMRLSAHNIFVSQRNVILALSPNSLINYRLKKRYTLLPCGVNLTDDQLTLRTETRQSIRKELGVKNDELLFLCATGGGAAWQNDKIMITKLAQAGYKFINLSPNAIDSPNVCNKVVPFDYMPNYLSAADVAILWREDNPVNNVASPSKFSEFAVMGLYVIHNGTVDLAKNYIEKYDSGCIVTDIDNVKISTIQEILAKRISWIDFGK